MDFRLDRREKSASIGGIRCGNLDSCCRNFGLVSESSYEASAGSSEENALNENDSCNGENDTLSESEEASADDAEEVKQD